MGLNAGKKASAFAQCFLEKCALPDLIQNNYTPESSIVTQGQGLRLGAENRQKENNICPTVKDVALVLEKLRVDSASGPDKVPTRLLKECASILAVPIRELIIVILKTSIWPRIWAQHWIFPLHKRKATFLASNYRGIHLTSQISKVAERVLAELFVPELEAKCCFGPNQFAYSKGKGARDAIALLVLQWIRGWSAKKIWAMYCSDVSGAFDKVSSALLIAKLRQSGISSEIVSVLESWLAPRSAQVVVDGDCSETFVLEEMVFQGTVFGPPLWNFHFADARHAINKIGFQEIVFADDLNAYKAFAANTEHAILETEMQKCQAELHKWGHGNQVQFDSSKENMHVLAPQGKGAGDDFKLLGIIFDSALSMENELRNLVRNVRWKNQSVLRCKKFFSTHDLVNLYKSQVLSYIEYRTPGIYHACNTHLDRLDATQTQFLQELGIDEADALLSYGLAPLKLRRDIAMLGVIQRSIAGKGPAQFGNCFVLQEQNNEARRTRQCTRKHNKQLVDVREGRFLEIVKRSALGLIAVYNLLPQRIVDEDVVCDFQKLLQDFVKSQINADNAQWRDLFSPRIAMFQHPLRAL